MKQTKQALRAAVRQQKRAMSREAIEAKSELLCRRVLQTPAYASAAAVYGYLPFNQEVNLLPLLQKAIRDGKQVALPKCYGSEMRFILIADLSRVRVSALGAPEPVDDLPVARDDTALVIVPGLVFDERGYRIGYGGGYYDRFLAREPEHPTIALCYDFQVMPFALKREPHDIPAGRVMDA